jgi:PAS domain S-box-containing protein
MDENKYKNILDNSPTGFAYHKIICDEEGVPCDYEFLEVKESFEKYTGLKADMVIGKRVTEVIPGIVDDEFDWIGMYGKIALKNGSETFEHFSQGLNRHYRVKVYSPEKNYFVTLFSDITSETIKEKKHETDFKALFENMQSGAAIYEVINDGKHGRDYIVCDFNKESLRIENKTINEVVGKSLYELRPNIDEFGLIETFREVWETGVPKKFPSTVYTDDKYNNWYENYVYKLSENKIVAVYRDVTEYMQAQQKLKVSNEKLENYIMKAPIGIFVTNKNGRFLEFNRQLKKITGFKEKELLDLEVEDIIVEEEHVSSMAAVERLYREGRVQSIRKITTKKKDIRYVDINTVSIGDDKYLNSVQDITERIQFEHQLNQERRLLKKYLDVANIMFVVLGADEEVKSINKEGCKILGLDEKEVLGKNWFDNFIPKDVMLEVKQVFKKVIKKEVENVEYFENAIVNLKGEERIISWHNTVLHDENGVVISILSAGIDITEKKKAKTELIESELKHRTMISNISDVICIIGLDGEAKYVSENITRVVGWQPEELIGIDSLYYAHPDDLERIKSEFEDIIHHPNAIRKVEFRILHKDNSYRHIRLTAKNMIGESTISGLLINYNDITDEKALEKERARLEEQLRNQQKLESIGTLASGVAHEINNPINGIMNYGQIILDTKSENPDINESAKEIIHESQRVAEIVKNLLEFSRQNTESNSTARVEDIIERTLSLIRTVVRHDQIDLKIDVEKDLPDVECRSQQIQQVLMNLFTNARDALNNKYEGYHEDKKIIVQSSRIRKDETDWIRITVEDHGVGIPKSLQEKIFDPFFTTKERHKGTGLGLSISYGIIQEHGGELSFESKEGEYTRFYIDLPIEN